MQELIKFGMMLGGPRHIHVIDAIVNDVISLGPSQGMNVKEAEDISCLYLQVKVFSWKFSSEGSY